MSGDVRVLTYDELGEALGIARESARQLSIRRHWKRRKGNDRKARVEVPAEVLAAAHTDNTDTATPDTDAARPGTDTKVSHTDAEVSAITVLTRHVERLEAEISELRPKAAAHDSLRELLAA